QPGHHCRANVVILLPAFGLQFFNQIHMHSLVRRSLRLPSTTRVGPVAVVVPAVPTAAAMSALTQQSKRSICGCPHHHHNHSHAPATTTTGAAATAVAAPHHYMSTRSAGGKGGGNRGVVYLKPGVVEIQKIDYPKLELDHPSQKRYSPFFPLSPPPSLLPTDL